MPTSSDVDDPVPVTTVRTPHLAALVTALEARDIGFETISGDRLRVRGMAPDDLGWLAASAGVVVYEMVTAREP
jgi:hypothetical protein